jgi:hypothetical protein
MVNDCIANCEMDECKDPHLPPSRMLELQLVAVW